jgi:hypothetical protein
MNERACGPRTGARPSHRTDLTPSACAASSFRAKEGFGPARARDARAHRGPVISVHASGALALRCGGFREAPALRESRTEVATRPVGTTSCSVRQDHATRSIRGGIGAVRQGEPARGIARNDGAVGQEKVSGAVEGDAPTRTGPRTGRRLRLNERRGLDDLSPRRGRDAARERYRDDTNGPEPHHPLRKIVDRDCWSARRRVKPGGAA